MKDRNSVHIHLFALWLAIFMLVYSNYALFQMVKRQDQISRRQDRINDYRAQEIGMITDILSMMQKEDRERLDSELRSMHISKPAQPSTPLYLN